MGAIKDIHDLTAGLINSVKDRHVVAELMKIQAAISSFQSEHFEARERNVNLLADNLRLQQEIRDLVSSHTAAMAEKDKEIAKLKKDSAEEVSALKKSHEDAIANIHEHYSDPNRNSPFGSGLGDIENLI